MNHSVVKEIYLGGRANLLLATIGHSAGTRYAVSDLFLFLSKFMLLNIIYLKHFVGFVMLNKTCDEISLLKRLHAEDQFQPNGASDLTYNFYDIHNPKEYLKGEDAVVVERGPYMIK